MLWLTLSVIFGVCFGFFFLKYERIQVFYVIFMSGIFFTMPFISFMVASENLHDANDIWQSKFWDYWIGNDSESNLLRDIYFFHLLATFIGKILCDVKRFIQALS